MMFVVIQHVEAQVMREILRRNHQPKRGSTKKIIPFPERLTSGGRLFCPEEEIERKQHEEDEQRIFLPDPVVSNGVNPKRPESSGEQSGPAIKKGGTQKKERYHG